MGGLDGRPEPGAGRPVGASQRARLGCRLGGTYRARHGLYFVRWQSDVGRRWEAPVPSTPDYPDYGPEYYLRLGLVRSLLMDQAQPTRLIGSSSATPIPCRIRSASHCSNGRG